MSERHGLFVVFEGGDGVGKTTQVTLVADELVARGHDVVRTREPGATGAGKVIRDLLLSPSTGDLEPRAEALLYAADKAQHVAEVIRPALDRGAIVVCDRYVDSLIAYQGAGRVLAAEDVARLAHWATGGLEPDLTVLLDLDPTVAMAGLESPDRLEDTGEEFHRRVRAGFRALAATAPEQYLVLYARDRKEHLADRVVGRVEELLGVG